MTPASVTTLADLTRDGKHYARRGPSGVIEIVDAKSGDVVRLFKTLETPGALVPDEYVTHVTFNPFIVDLLCEKVANGDSVTAVCKEPGMPSYTTLVRWQTEYPEVARKLDAARLARTEHLRDLAVKIAMENVDAKFPTQAAKLKVEVLQWASGIDNPKYSPKAKVEATLTAPVQIIVQTGIDRTPLAEVREATTAPLETIAHVTEEKVAPTHSSDLNGVQPPSLASAHPPEPEAVQRPEPTPTLWEDSPELF